MQGLKFSYYTNRWGSVSILRLDATEDGWFFHAMAHSGPTNAEGAPHLKGNFDQDYVSYPHGVDGYLAFIWRQIRDDEIDQERAQEMFDQLGEWVSASEQSRPMWRGWNC